MPKRKYEIIAAFMTAVFIAFTLGYFIGRGSASLDVSYSVPSSAASQAGSGTPASHPPPSLPVAASYSGEPGPASASPESSPESSPETPPEPGQSLYIDGKLDINKAAAADLTSLPGVGETLAARIVEYRERLGRFSDIIDILGVSGIGQSKFEAIKNLITVEAQP